MFISVTKSIYNIDLKLDNNLKLLENIKGNLILVYSEEDELIKKSRF